MKVKLQPKRIALYLIAALVLLLQVYPLFWVFISSFKSAEAFRQSSLSLPSSLYLDNYRMAFSSGYMPWYFLNSAVVTSFSVALIVLISGMAAFAIQKIRFGLNRQVLSFFLFGILVPIQITLIPLFTMINRSGLSSTYLGLILSNVGFSLPIAIYLFTSFLEFLPNEVLESAVIDGCTLARMFLHIVMPMSVNVIVTLIVLYGVHTWNEFIFAFTFTNRRDMYTVPVGLRDFFGRYGTVNWTVCFAAIAATTTPTLIVYFLFNKTMIAGLTAGAVKG
jgi:raffinose/stachyose/melibiose transport system permease protein